MSDILMCPVCCKIYHKDRINKERAFCPDLECWGGGIFELFEIDELMIEPIRILNYKEYITKFCCSGHSYSSSKRAYISFHIPWGQCRRRCETAWTHILLPVPGRGSPPRRSVPARAPGCRQYSCADP